MQFCLLDADYIIKDEKGILRLFGKDDKGNSVIAFDEKFKPYFYVLPKSEKESKVKNEILKIKEFKINDVQTDERKLNGKKQKFLKVVCDLPPSVPNVRDIVKEWKDVAEEYEYAISFYKRWLIDHKISGLNWIEIEGGEIKTDYKVDKAVKIEKIKPLDKEKLPELNILAFDIECIGEKIIMLSLAGKNLKKVLTYQRDSYPGWVEVVKDEKELLERFVEIVNSEDVDLLLGYNSDEFDFQIIQKRADELKVKLAMSRDGSWLKFARRARISSARFKGRVHIDLFNFINNILSPQLQTEVLSLDAVSAELLGDTKIEMQFEEILEAWKRKNDLAKLAEYCLKDSELTLRLAELILPQIFELSKVIGQLPFDTSRMTYGQLVEWYLSKKAFELAEVIPNQPKYEEIQKRRLEKPYIGGFVLEPKAGIHENIAVLDFKSLYPSIISTFNISPEMLNCECCKPGYKVPGLKYWFCKKKKGFVSTVINELIESRKAINQKLKKLKKGSLDYKLLDSRQYALKIVSNSAYGLFGFAGAKWYSRQCAESITAFGRSAIKQTIDAAQKEGFTVLYSDTDSCFVKLLKGNLVEKTKQFLKKINKELPGIMELELQGIYTRGIFIPRGIGPGTAKKRYALIDEKGNLLIRGLETVRRDWCQLAKQTQRDVLTYVLGKKDVKDAVKYVQDVIQKLRERKVELKHLTIYEQLTKPLEEYKAIGPHVVAAQKIKQRGRPIGPGMVIMFAVTKGPGSISERAEPIEDVELKDIDTDYYIYHQIVPAALRVLQVLGITKEELLGITLKRFLARK